MSQNRSLVRASDIGLWAYCHRAWWLAKVKGAAHANPDRLDAGTASHLRHGTQVARADTLMRMGLVLIVLALLVAGALLILWAVTQ
jgi:hypothetical protein